MSIIHQNRKNIQFQKDSKKTSLEHDLDYKSIQKEYEFQEKTIYDSTDFQVQLIRDVSAKEAIDYHLSRLYKKINKKSSFIFILLTTTLTFFITFLFDILSQTVFSRHVNNAIALPLLIIMVVNFFNLPDGKERGIWKPCFGKSIISYIQSKLFSKQLLEIDNFKNASEIQTKRIQKNTLNFLTEFIKETNHDCMIEQNGEKYFKVSQKDKLVKLTNIEKSLREMSFIEPNNKELFDKKMWSLTSQALHIYD